MREFVNYSLTVTGAECMLYGKSGGKPPMIAKFFYTLWTGRNPADSGPASMDAAKAPDELRTEEFNAEQLRRERDADEVRRKSDDHAWEDFRLLSHSGELSRLLQNVLNDLDDAILAARIALEEALKEEQQALQGLEDARAGAITLGDGRKVYFSADGTLYGEDGKAITSADAIAEAQRRRAANPGATSFEDFQARERAWREAAERAQFLADLLDRLDSLREKLKAGEITAAELAEAERNALKLIHSLPTEAQREYEGIRARRNTDAVAYRTAGEFENDAASVTARPTIPQPLEPEATKVETRVPVYKTAPDF